MQPQPDETTCGPTCLHAVYSYFGEKLDLLKVIEEVENLENGGTLAVMLGVHALSQKFHARIITYNLQIFDPTWFTTSGLDISKKLRLQAREKRNRQKLVTATRAYLRFLELGGIIEYRTLRPDLIRDIIENEGPILTGLSSTFLYNTAREFGPQSDYDDLRGFPGGHFVVLSGYDRISKKVQVADPYQKNPISTDLYYQVDVHRIINAILLGILTYDANLLILTPAD